MDCRICSFVYSYLMYLRCPDSDPDRWKWDFRPGSSCCWEERKNWGNANWRNFAQSTQFVCLWNGPRPHEKLLRKMPSVPPPNPYANHLDRRPFTQASKLLTLTRHRPRFWDLIYGPFRIHSKELRPAVGIAIYRPFTKNIFRRHTQQWNSRGIRQNLLAGQTFKKNCFFD